MIYNGEECYGVIYKITHRESGKCYIGQTTNAHRRFLVYRNKLAKGQPKLHSAFVKYGVDAFDFTIIYTAYAKVQLDYLECYFVEEYRTLSEGYNCREGGSTWRHSAESKARIGLASTGRKVSEETRLKHASSARAQVRTLETRQKISQAQRGKKRTPEHRANIRAGLLAKFPQGQLGACNHNAKPVFCVTTGKTYSHILAAAKDTGIAVSPIRSCCKGDSAYGGKLPDGTPLIWNYVDKQGSPIPHSRKFVNKCNHGVLCITTGMVYTRIVDASVATKIHVSSISLCCRGKQKYAGKLPDGTPLVWAYTTAHTAAGRSISNMEAPPQQADQPLSSPCEVCKIA